jgi:hypothetical protein
MGYFAALPSCIRNMGQNSLFWWISILFHKYVLKWLILSRFHWTFQTPTRGLSIQSRAFCHGLGLQLKLHFEIRTKARQNPWRSGLFWSLLSPQKVKSPFCHKFYGAKRAYIAIIAISGRFFGRIKGNIRTYAHHTENNRGRLVEPIPNKGALNSVLRTEYQKKSAPVLFKRRENSADL